MVRILVFVAAVNVCSVGLCQAQQESAAGAKDYFFPLAAALSQEELFLILQHWDAALENDLITSKSVAVMSVAQYVDKSYRYSGARVLRYNNPEIIDRVVALYLWECNKRGDPYAGMSQTNPWNGGEGGHEYLEALMTIAESTLDPRIWELQLMPPEMDLGECRLLYLAAVNPEETLTYLLESKRGERIGSSRPGHQDYFYHGATAFQMSVIDAYALLSLMSEQSPAALRKQREKTLSFVKQHHKHYAAPRAVSYRSQPVYDAGRDYIVRNGALDVLALLGGKEDVALVHDIMQNAPALDPAQYKRISGGSRVGEKISDKGLRVIRQIR